MCVDELIQPGLVGNLACGEGHLEELLVQLRFGELADLGDLQREFGVDALQLVLLDLQHGSTLRRVLVKFVDVDRGLEAHLLADERLALFFRHRDQPDVSVGHVHLAVVERYGQRLVRGHLAASLTRAGFRAVTFTYPGGEHCKTLATYAALLDFLAAHRLSRSDLIVALGGGVTGDLAGFAAATYQRGIPFVQVPTTLLAAVDSSVGGKTAVNLASGKNQVGCFYQPSLVLCDPDTLRTLPPEEYRNGCAEVIKYAVLRSEPFFDALRAEPVSAQVEHVIATCVSMKRDLVAADEFDRGSRQLLNLGHSFGHAVEKCSDYAVPHGCGVAIGMAIIARAAAKRGICTDDTCAQILALLRKYGLPTETAFTRDALTDAARSDKKIADGKLHLIVPERIGRCRIETIPAVDIPAWLADGGIA